MFGYFLFSLFFFLFSFSFFIVTSFFLSGVLFFPVHFSLFLYFCLFLTCCVFCCSVHVPVSLFDIYISSLYRIGIHHLPSPITIVFISVHPPLPCHMPNFSIHNTILLIIDFCLSHNCFHFPFLVAITLFVSCITSLALH